MSNNSTTKTRRNEAAVPLPTGKTLYITATGVKLGTKGKVQPINAVYNAMVKSQRRQVRKALRAAGFIYLASQPSN